MPAHPVALPDEVQKDLLRAGWYAHDARWYAAATEEIGIEATNRLNRRAARAAGRAEARRLAAALGVEKVGTLPQFLEMVEAGRTLYVPASLIDMTIEPLDDETYRVSVSGCYVSQNIAKAGVADVYECAVFDRMEGWHEALGLPLAEAPAAETCAKAAGRPCVRMLRVAALPVA